MLTATEPLHETMGLRAWGGRHSPGMPQAHRHNELELNYILRGTMTYLVNGAQITVPARRLCALWGAVPHQTVSVAPRGDEPIEAMWVTVPLAQALAWDLPAGLARRLLRSGCVIEKSPRPADEALLSQWIADLRDPAGAAGRAALLEIEARLCRMAARLGRATARAPQTEIPATVERLARFLAANYRRPVSVDDAARGAHVHAHYAMALFRRHTGLTLHQYLTIQRVAHAQRLLATTRASVLDVALESGFASVSRFYAAFTAQAGTSPRRFRHRLAGRSPAGAGCAIVRTFPKPCSPSAI